MPHRTFSGLGLWTWGGGAGGRPDPLPLLRAVLGLEAALLLLWAATHPSPKHLSVAGVGLFLSAVSVRECRAWDKGWVWRRRRRAYP